ncbi:MAG: Hydroxypyruvate reductase [Anaerolineales bacterium]|nr:Hydroxypyruvate reductase [Anaerolineales bacterium]
MREYSVKGKILVTARSFRKVQGSHQQSLSDAGYSIVESPHDRPLEPAELAGLMGDVVGVILGVDEVTPDVINRAARLRVLSRFGVGVDNIDLKAASRRGIVVTNTPGANSVSVAELTIGLMLALARHIAHHDCIVKQGGWERIRGVELSGGLLGLVGLGSIGQAVAQRALGFGMRIVYYDPLPPPQEVIDSLPASACTFEDTLSQSDVVSLHCPLNDNTRRLINRRAIERMKPSALLINTARGGLVDEVALYDGLAQGKISGAASDVFTQEPPRDSSLLALDNFIATPHIGASTRQAAVRVGQMAAENALAVLRGERPEHVVNPEVYER